MLEIRPHILRVLLANYSAFLTSTVIFAVWKWVLDWPAVWVAFFLIARATYLSVLYFPRMSLVVDANGITGPSGPAYIRTTISTDTEISREKRFGHTFLRDSAGTEIWYREGWFSTKDISSFHRLVARVPKIMGEQGIVPNP